MGFTDKELKFIDDNSELIEKGESGLKELFSKIDYEIEKRDKMKILLAYNCLGTDAFKVSTKTTTVDKVITGALFNRTTCKAKGEPLLPSMFRGNTKVVLYNIRKGKIIDQKNYTLVDRQSLDKVSLEGGYNLCVLNKPEHLATVKDCFDGTLNYIAYFDLKDDLGDYSTEIKASIQTNDEEVAKNSILQRLRETLNRKIEGFSKVIDDIMAYVESNLVF